MAFTITIIVVTISYIPNTHNADPRRIKINVIVFNPDVDPLNGKNTKATTPIAIVNIDTIYCITFDLTSFVFLIESMMASTNKNVPVTRIVKEEINVNDPAHWEGSIHNQIPIDNSPIDIAYLVKLLFSLTIIFIDALKVPSTIKAMPLIKPTKLVSPLIALTIARTPIVIIIAASINFQTLYSVLIFSYYPPSQIVII